MDLPPHYIQDSPINIQLIYTSALLILTCTFISPVFASAWHPVMAQPSIHSPVSDLKIIAYYDLDTADLVTQINSPPSDSSILIELPSGTNNLLMFKLSVNQVLPEVLASHYPNIQTFNLIGVDHKSRGKLEIRPNGIYAAYRVEGHSYYLEPDTTTGHYRFYDAREQLRQPFTEQVRQLNLPALTPVQNKVAKPMVDGTIRQYRLAIATTGEYNAKFGSNKESVLAELATVVNRLNLVYEVDMGVSFVLAEDNDKLIFLDADTDPFVNNIDDIDAAGDVIDQAIGNNSYDIGHVFTTNGGGLASVGVVCMAYKADGVTGSNRPSGDSFYIDLVAHEIAHQLGANHTFNSESGSCENNRNVPSAWESGSGSTIMGYAGICGAENLQNYSDDYFHIGSILEYRQQLSSGMSGNCGQVIAGTNDAPTADAGSDYIIPANSPFVSRLAHFNPRF